MGVAVVDYNAGNIYSVVHALERLGENVQVTDDPMVINQADHVIFPGQGEAGCTMAYLHEKGLDRVIRQLKQPVLGICIGMQLMCAHSEEGDTECLGIFDAKVTKFVAEERAQKIPHMGWNTLTHLGSPLFEGLKEEDFVYFIHSYYVPLADYTIARTDYIHPYSAAIHQGNFHAVQFHPEKSGKVGERILKNFLSIPSRE